MIWHAETQGRPDDSSEPDRSFNPASVAKLATTLWALERLGPASRFETRFASSGAHDDSTGTLPKNLVVVGAGDPDFHVENAYLVARGLNGLGIRAARGDILVDEAFWIGWEGGAERREPDAARRILLMAGALQDALDPDRWDRRTRRLIQQFAARREIADAPPRVAVHGSPGPRPGASLPPTLVLHRSNELKRILKRFNAYSNHAIERLGTRLGSPDDMAVFLAERWKVDRSTLEFATLSGLGSNRMTPRLVVRLLRDLDATCRRLGLRIEDVLPVAGCDPGTLDNFPRFEFKLGGALVAKTGSLNRTDGGIAVLAGIARSSAGSTYFCVAAPRAGGRLNQARGAQQRWLLERVARNGGPEPVECGDPVYHSDTDAHVIQLAP